MIIRVALHVMSDPDLHPIAALTLTKFDSSAIPSPAALHVAARSVMPAARAMLKHAIPSDRQRHDYAALGPRSVRAGSCALDQPDAKREAQRSDCSRPTPAGMHGDGGG